MKVKILGKGRLVIGEMELPFCNERVHDIINSPLGDEVTDAYISLYGSDFMSDCLLHFKNVDLMNLIELADKLKGFNEKQRGRFIGGCNLLGKQKLLTQREVNNVAENVIQNKSLEHYPAWNSIELAVYFLENELIEEVGGIDFAAYEWIVEKLDLEKVGKSIEARFNGEFEYNSYGCVVLSGEIEDLYQEPQEDQEQGMGGIGC